MSVSPTHPTPGAVKAIIGEPEVVEDTAATVAPVDAQEREVESEDAAARNAEWTCALSDWEEAVAEVDRQGQKLQK